MPVMYHIVHIAQSITVVKDNHQNIGTNYRVSGLSGYVAYKINKMTPAPNGIKRRPKTTL